VDQRPDAAIVPPARRRSIAAGSDASPLDERRVGEPAGFCTYDRVYGELGDQIRGVEGYENPFEGGQSSCRTAACRVSSSGEYALSDNALQPERRLHREWRQLKPTRSRRETE
jgi:hypothetical protein